MTIFKKLKIEGFVRKTLFSENSFVKISNNKYMIYFNTQITDKKNLTLYFKVYNSESKLIFEETIPVSLSVVGNTFFLNFYGNKSIVIDVLNSEELASLFKSDLFNCPQVSLDLKSISYLFRFMRYRDLYINEEVKTIVKIFCMFLNEIVKEEEPYNNVSIKEIFYTDESNNPFGFIVYEESENIKILFNYLKESSFDELNFDRVFDIKSQILFSTQKQYDITLMQYVLDAYELIQKDIKVEFEEITYKSSIEYVSWEE